MKKTFKRILAGAMACALTIGISATAVAISPMVVFYLPGYSRVIGSVSYKTYSSNNVVFTATSRSTDGRAIPKLYAGVIVTDIVTGNKIYQTYSKGYDKNSYSISTYGMTQKPMTATGKHNARNAQGKFALEEDASTFIVFDPDE